MIDLQIILPALIFLPALLGFLGCVFPEIIFPLGILASWLCNILGGFTYAFTLGWVGFNFQ